MRVVLAGFGPFPGAPFNPSAAVINALAQRRRPALANVDRISHVFATAYASVDRDLPKLLAAKPDAVLIVGVAGRRRVLCIETRARNALSVLYPDASGHRPAQGVIHRGAVAERRSRAPVAALQAAARSRKISVRLSRDAGRYLCNYAYWRALERADDRAPLVQFVHIPAVMRKSRPRRQLRTRQTTLRDLVEALEAVLIALIAATRR